MGNVIKAPNPVPLGVQTVFLAGSIEMGKAQNWQKIAEKNLDEGFTILNPRRDDWDSSWEQTIKNEHFAEQVRWELDAMDFATHILMYFDPATKSPITLMELGLHATSGKLVVCCPQGFWRRGNVEVVSQWWNIPLFTTLAAGIDHINAA